MTPLEQANALLKAAEIVALNALVKNYEDEGKPGDEAYWEACNKLDDTDEDAPSLASALLEKQKALEECIEHLKVLNKLIAEGSTEGFNPLAGDWAERLFFSQQKTSKLLRDFLARQGETAS